MFFYPQVKLKFTTTFLSLPPLSSPFWQPNQRKATLMRRFKKVLKCKIKVLNDDSHPDLIPILVSMSIFYRHRYERYQESLDCYDEAQRILKKAMMGVPEGSEKMKQLKAQYAGVLWGGGHIRGLHMPLDVPEHMQQGLQMLDECLEILRKEFREDGLFTSEDDFFKIPNTRKMLGLCYKRCEKYELAKEHLEACLPGFVKHLNIDHHHVRFLTRELASVYQSLNDHHAVVELLSKWLANGIFPEFLGVDRGQDSALLSLLYMMFQSFCHLYKSTPPHRPSLEWLKPVHGQITMHLGDLKKSFGEEKLIQVMLMDYKLSEIASELSISMAALTPTLPAGVEGVEQQELGLGGEAGDEPGSQGNYKRSRWISRYRGL